MNKFPISLSPVKCSVNGRTNQHFNLEQKMVFRIDTMEVRNEHVCFNPLAAHSGLTRQAGGNPCH